MGVGTLYIAYSGHGWVQTILLSLSTINIPSCLGREKCERTKEGGAEEVDCIFILQPQLGRRKKGRLYLHRGKTVENKPSVEKKESGIAAEGYSETFASLATISLPIKFQGRCFGKF